MSAMRVEAIKSAGQLFSLWCWSGWSTDEAKYIIRLGDLASLAARFLWRIAHLLQEVVVRVSGIALSNKHCVGRARKALVWSSHCHLKARLS